MKRKKRSLFRLLVLLSLLVILGISVAAGYAYFKVKGTADSIHEPIAGRTKSDLRDKAVSINNKDAISVALFGVDSNQERLATGDAGRSDSIMLLSINPKTKQSMMVSVPRDTYSEMVGKGTNEKIAHAYAYGGAAMAVKSVEQLMGVPIDYYATVNMDGLEQMVDDVGGIDVTSNATFSYAGYDFVKGQSQHMDGKTALAFIRSRKETGAGGDFGRQERQQLVVQGLAQQVLSVGSVTKFNSILKTVEGNVVTDLTFDDLTGLRSGYSAALDHVEKYQLEGDGAILEDGLWYFMPDETKKANIRELYNHNLE